jgi:hypothetical protein
MQIPVQYTTFDKELNQELFEQQYYQPEQQLFNKVQIVPFTTTRTGSIEEEILKQQLKKQTLKKWLNTIQLEKEILERELTHRNFNIHVDPTKRIVIVKVQTPCNTIVLCKKFVQVPENVNIHQLKVRVQPEQKIILIKAPFYQTLDQQLAKNMTIFQDQQTVRMFEEELSMDRVMETEPTLYKMCQAMRQHLPTFFVPRVIRHLESGLLKVVLDIVCDQEHMQIRPQDLLVKVHEIERCLAIKVLCDKLLNNTARCQQMTPFFQPKQMCHEFLLPTFVNVAKVNWFQKTNNVIRIELPIIREQLRTILDNTRYQDNQWTRCL